MASRGIAWAPMIFAASAAAAPFAYVPDGNFKVSVIDLATNTVVTRITGDWVIGGVAVSRAGNRAYIANGTTNTVAVVDTTTNSTIANLDVCSQPNAIALNAAGTKLVVPCVGLIPPTFVSVIVDTTTFETTILPALNGWSAAWNDPRGKFYIASNTRIFVYDAQSLNLVKTLGVPDGVFGLAVNPTGTRLYAASSKSPNGDFGENTLTVYDAAADSEIKRVALAGPSGWIAMDPSGSRLYVPITGNDALAVYDADANLVTMVQLPSGSRPQSVSVHPDGSRVYVQAAGQLLALQPPGYAIVSTVAYGTQFASANGSFVGNGSAATAPNLPGALSGVWWNPQQSGWGMGLTQRGLNIFATWFTYDTHGSPTWHVATCRMSTPYSCSGSLFQITGTRFDFTGPYDARFAETVQTGTLTMAFLGASTGAMNYAVGDFTDSVNIQRQPLASQGAYPAVNYTDLWWNPDQSGWGIQITHQRNTMFLAWFVYDAAFKPMWYVMSCATNTAGNACSGTIYRTTGPDFQSEFDARQVRALPAGTMTVTFTGLNDARLDYTVDGVSGSKNVTRQLF